MIDRVLVGEALSQLKPDHRRVLLLRLAGTPYSEIAAKTGVTGAAARQVYHRSLARVRRHLEP